MVNPDEITKYDRTSDELQEVALFWIAVAGKTAHVIKKRLDRVLAPGRAAGLTPFGTIRSIPSLPRTLKEAGIGCFNGKAKAMLKLAYSDLDLFSCSYECLRQYGMGIKSAKCFLIHSRANYDGAGLDTHILGLLREEYPDTLWRHGIDPDSMPKSTPSNPKVYARIEKVVVEIYRSEGMTAAEWDLGGWKSRRRKPNE